MKVSYHDDVVNYTAGQAKGPEQSHSLTRFKLHVSSSSRKPPVAVFTIDSTSAGAHGRVQEAIYA